MRGEQWVRGEEPAESANKVRPHLNRGRRGQEGVRERKGKRGGTALKKCTPHTLGASLHTTRTVFGGLSQCSVSVVVLGAISSSHWQAGSLGEAASGRGAAEEEPPSREDLLEAVPLRPLAVDALWRMPPPIIAIPVASPEADGVPPVADALCRMPPLAAVTPSLEASGACPAISRPCPAVGPATSAPPLARARSADGPATSADGPVSAGKCVHEDEGVSDGEMCGEPRERVRLERGRAEERPSVVGGGWSTLWRRPGGSSGRWCGGAWAVPKAGTSPSSLGCPSLILGGAASGSVDISTSTRAAVAAEARPAASSTSISPSPPPPLLLLPATADGSSPSPPPLLPATVTDSSPLPASTSPSNEVPATVDCSSPLPAPSPSEVPSSHRESGWERLRRGEELPSSWLAERREMSKSPANIRGNIGQTCCAWL